MKAQNRRLKPIPGLLAGIWQSASMAWRAIFTSLGILIVLNFSILLLWGWYVLRHQSEPTVIGATFIPNYARHFNLQPQETLDAIINDLGVRHLRLVSYWNIHEPKRGEYNFSELDWQFQMARESGTKVSLAIGLRQPRWPECHLPDWAQSMNKDEWYPELKKYITKVVERYGDDPALESYQLENEFFLKAFGICPDHDRQRLIEEYGLVKSLDDDTPVIISRSNNAMGWPVYDPIPDQYAVSVYKRVWDKTITKRYFEYPFPPQFYGALAAVSQITQNKTMFIHELQSEAWGSKDIKDLDITEANKTMDASKMRERIDYGAASGMKRLDLWGVEWWYYRKKVMGEHSLWISARDKIEQANLKENSYRYKIINQNQ